MPACARIRSYSTDALPVGANKTTHISQRRTRWKVLRVPIERQKAIDSVLKKWKPMNAWQTQTTTALGHNMSAGQVTPHMRMHWCARIQSSPKAMLLIGSTAKLVPLG